MTTHRTKTLVLSAALALSCGGGAASSGGADSPSGSGAPPAAKKFDDLSHDERMEFMAAKVLPEMKTLFQGHDAKEFAEFQCSTCHGEDFQKVDYHMPNSLYALPEANPMEDAKAYNAEMTEFMATKIVPKMTELLGEPVSCHTCHPKS